MGETRNSQNINLAGARRFSIRDITNVGGARQDHAGEQDQPVCRILLLGANPSNTSRLRLDREARAIEDALHTSPGSRRFELLQGWASSALDVQQDLFRHQPDLIHFSGHGSSEGELVLEANKFRELARKDAGSPGAGARSGAPAPIAALARLLAHAPGRIRCVVLNACYSASLAEAIAEHADCAIGMTSEVSDNRAVAFAWGFYHALAQGESVAAAFDLGCAQVELRGSSQQQPPRLIALRRDPKSISWSD